MINKETKRNSFIEIYRLLASLWICYLHGYRLVSLENKYSYGYLAVEFFLIISGFYFDKIYSKESEKPFFNGLLSLVWNRFKPLLITFSICSVFSIIYAIENEEYLRFLGFLWFIPMQYIMMVFLYSAKRVYNKFPFLYISVFIIFSFAAYKTFSVDKSDEVMRSLFAFFLGYILSKIPRFKSNIISFIIVIFTFILTLYITCFSIEINVEKVLLLLILFPLLIYFSSCINFSNKYINVICSISVNIYMYQTVARLLEYYDLGINEGTLFIIVISLSIIDLLFKILFKSIKEKKLLNSNQNCFIK